MTDGAENKIVVVLEDLRDAIPPETRPLRRLLRWFETKNGSTILTFVLTGILGTAISFWFSYFQAERDRARTELAASEENWNNINDLLGVIAYSRLTDASLVASAMKWRGGADELKDRWKSYQASYRDYNISVYKGHLALRDFAPEENREIFNSYFFDVISTQFADIDDCLTRAYDAYNGEAAPGLNSIALLDARIAAAQQYQIHQQPGCPSIPVIERMNFDQTPVRGERTVQRGVRIVDAIDGGQRGRVVRRRP